MLPLMNKRMDKQTNKPANPVITQSTVYNLVLHKQLTASFIGK